MRATLYLISRLTLLVLTVLGVIYVCSLSRNALYPKYYDVAHRANELQRCLRALYAFAESHDTLPGPRGGPPFNDADVQLSWRSAVAPWLTGGWPELDWTLPWDDPTNVERAAKYYDANGAMWVYSFRTDSRQAHTVFGDTTNILAIVGGDTAFAEEHRERWRQLPNDLIVLVEARETGIPWWAPGDIDVDSSRFQLVPDSYEVALDGNGVLVVFADAEVWYLRASIPMHELAKFFVASRAEEFRRADVLTPYLIRRFPAE